MVFAHHEGAAFGDGVAASNAFVDLSLRRNDLDDRLRGFLLFLLALESLGFVSLGVGGILGSGIELRGGGLLGVLSFSRSFFGGFLFFDGLFDGGSLSSGSTILAGRRLRVCRSFAGTLNCREDLALLLG